MEALEVFKTRCLQTVRGITGADTQWMSKVRRALNLHQVPSDIEDIGSLNYISCTK